MIKLKSLVKRLNEIKRSMIQVETAKISALSSKNPLDKYEYLTDEDLGFKPNVF